MERITKRVIGVLAALLVFSVLLVGAVSAALEVQVSIYDDATNVNNWTYARGGTESPSEFGHEEGSSIYGLETFTFTVNTGDSFNVYLSGAYITLQRVDSSKQPYTDDYCTFTRNLKTGSNSLTYSGICIDGEPVPYSDPSGWIASGSAYSIPLDPSATTMKLILFTTTGDDIPEIPSISVDMPPSSVKVGQTYPLGYTVNSGSYALDQFIVESTDESIATAIVDTENHEIFISGEGVGKTNVRLYWLPRSDFGYTNTPITVTASPKVTFDAHGGSGEQMPDQTIVPGGKVEPLYANTYTAPSGQRFLEWNTATDGSGTTYYDQQPVADLDEDLYLYALWTGEGQYLVQFDANGGTGSMSVQPVTPKVEANLNSNTFNPPEGQTFDHWNTDPDGSGTPYDDEGSITLTSSDIILYAIWGGAIGGYTVTFHANEGSGTMDPQTFKVGVAQALSKNTFETYDKSKKFIQWNTAADGSGTPYNDQQVITLTGDLDLYAQWDDASKHVVTFDPNGGTGSMKAQLFTEGVAQTLTQNNFKPPKGYTFSEWNTDKDGKGTAYPDMKELELDSDLSLYAQWTKGGEGPVITFYANDGSEDTTEQYVESGVETALDPNKFTYSGHKFLTWNTAGDGTGIMYVDEQVVNLTADLELYAQWISEEEEGTVVSLTKGDEAPYEFSVPPTVELNKKLDGKVAGAVQIIVYKSLGEDGTYVNLLLTSDADEDPKDFSTFHVGNPKVEGRFATYTMATYSEEGLTTKEHDIYGYQRSGMETNNNIVMALSGVTPATSTKYIGFTTASLPTISGTYYGSLTFDAELVSP